MNKVFWNEELIDRIIKRLGDIIGTNIAIEVHEMDEEYYYELGEHKNLVGWESVSSKRFFFAPEICNHKEMPDEYILSAIAYAFCVKVILNNGQLPPMPDQMDSIVKGMFKQFGINYHDRYAIEDKVRPVRRELFLDSDNGGCYFEIGDQVRPEPAVKGWKYYTITDIYSDEEGIMITCKSEDDKITMEEAEFFRAFHLLS